MKLKPITLTLTLLAVTLAGCTGGSSSDADVPYTGNGNDVSSGSNDGEPRHLKLTYNGQGMVTVLETTGDITQNEVGSQAYVGSTETKTSLYIRSGDSVDREFGCVVNGDGMRNGAKDCIRYVKTVVIVDQNFSFCQAGGEPVADKITFTDLETGESFGTFNIANVPAC